MAGNQNQWCFLGIALIAVGVVVALRPRLSEFLAVDRCLDEGGSYDYAQGRCDRATNHPYVPWSERSSGSAPTLRGLVFLLGGALVLAFGRWRTGRDPP
jgi:drug/metabolite transporter (DMT)-like permease